MSLARRMLHLAALLTMTLLLSGCLKAHVNLTLNEDDTVDGSMIFAISREAADLTGQDPEALVDQMAGSEAPLPEGVEFESSPYDDGEFIGQEFTFSDAPLDTLAEDGGFTITREGAAAGGRSGSGR
jgi:hypothetical protein